MSNFGSEPALLNSEELRGSFEYGLRHARANVGVRAMTNGRATIKKEAYRTLRTVLEKGHRALMDWEKIGLLTPDQKKRNIIVIVDSVIYELKDVIPILAKLEHDPGAVYVAREWPTFVDTWQGEKARGKGNEALAIITRLREAAASLDAG
jgi:hypothetical protein